MNEEEMCCILCDKGVTELDSTGIEVKHNLLDEEPLDMIVLVCTVCYAEANKTDATLATAHMLINARIHRIRNPDTKYTP